MASLDVASLFTNIPQEETIKICCDSLYENQELLSKISKNQFQKVLRTALCRTVFYLMLSFINKLMGQLWISFWAQAQHIMNKSGPIILRMNLSLCLTNDMQMIYFFYFDLLEHFKKFKEYINTKHANKKFTNEKQVNRSLPLLDVLISRNNKGFTTTVYHKPKFSGVYSNFNNFIVDEYKHGLIYTLHRKKLTDVIIWKMHGFPHKLPHSTGKCNKTHGIRKVWETDTHTFPMVWELFSHSIPILWYTSAYGKCMGFPINFPHYKKMQQN